MATGVTLGYNFRTVDVNSEAIAELKQEVANLPAQTPHTIIPKPPKPLDMSIFLTLAQFNEFKDAQVADRQWMVDALYNLHLKFDEFLMGYYNTVPPPSHEHTERDLMKLTYVSP